MAEQSVTLNPGESKVASFEAVPMEAKTYQVLVDGLSGSFRAIATPLTGAFCGKLVQDIGCVPVFWVYYGAAPDWWELTGDRWTLPPRTNIRLMIKVRNTSGVAARFNAGLQPKYFEETTGEEYHPIERDVFLEPGQFSDYFHFEFRTFGQGEFLYDQNGQPYYPEGTNIWVFRLYADGQVVDEIQKTVTTF